MIYVYECKPCEKQIEIMAPIQHDKPVCDECKQEMDKKICATSFILKGSGWYRDGYSSKK
jgi:putative FmdB family regulatory protein